MLIVDTTCAYIAWWPYAIYKSKGIELFLLCTLVYSSLVPLSKTPFEQYSLYCANGIIGNGNQTTIYNGRESGIINFLRLQLLQTFHHKMG
jgi:hypothetical protein